MCVGRCFSQRICSASLVLEKSKLRGGLFDDGKIAMEAYRTNALLIDAGKNHLFIEILVTDLTELLFIRLVIYIIYHISTWLELFNENSITSTVGG